MKEYKMQVVGWLLTVILSILGAWGTMNARMYEVEKRIEIIQLQIDNSQKATDQNQMDLKEIRILFDRIDKSITEINGKLQLKEDKKWK